MSTMSRFASAESSTGSLALPDQVGVHWAFDFVLARGDTLPGSRRSEEQGPRKGVT